MCIKNTLYHPQHIILSNIAITLKQISFQKKKNQQIKLTIQIHFVIFQSSSISFYQQKSVNEQTHCEIVLWPAIKTATNRRVTRMH